MSDFFKDPDHPRRPNTADFWKLSEIILKMDGRATEDPNGFTDTLAETGDPESISYVAVQRAMRLLPLLAELLTSGDTARMMGALAGTWTDGFVAGAEFERGKR